MQDYLMFCLYGPLAAWGDIAVGEYRPSFAHPSKSAIIGLLAAALGIRRDEEERQQTLALSCSFAVRVDSIGVLLRDYHTTETPRGTGYPTRRNEIIAIKSQKGSGKKFEGTILSKRDYRCDAVYTVAISVAAHSLFSVQQLADKLRRPEFTLYLGRKSCPLALPIHPRIVKAATLRDAFEKIASAEELSKLIPQGHPMVYWEDDSASGLERHQIIIRRDMPRSRNRWQFGERRENSGLLRKEV